MRVGVLLSGAFGEVGQSPFHGADSQRDDRQVDACPSPDTRSVMFKAAAQCQSLFNFNAGSLNDGSSPISPATQRYQGIES